MTKQLNITAIKALAIATAHYQRDWTPGTSIEEVYDDFKQLIIQAEDNLHWVGIDEEITEADIAEALWGMDKQEYNDWLDEMGVDMTDDEAMSVIQNLY